MRINLFYPAVGLLGVALIFLFRPPGTDELSFFGFAESNETAINYNYPVVVDEIVVQPGQQVRAGEPLLKVSRRKSKETLADQQYRIAELRSEEKLWRERKNNELKELQLRATNDLAGKEAKLRELKAELQYKRSLAEGLQTISVPEASYQPLVVEIAELESNIARGQELTKLREQGLGTEARLGVSPYAERIRRLEAEIEFDASQRVLPFIVQAPSDGLVGNINVKEAEHIQSYETLLTFYEPHSNLVRGYVHEDQTLRVGLGDRFEVYSLKTSEVVYEAAVTGLGSRIVEIPTRLRKLPDFRTYGREVVLEISPENSLLQKEKVGIRAVAELSQK